MISKDGKSLNVFDNFFIDRELPKYKKEKVGSLDNEMLSTPSESSGFGNDGFNTNFGGVIRHRPEDEALWNGISVETKSKYLRIVGAQLYDYIVGIKPIPRSKNIFKRWLLKKLIAYVRKKLYPENSNPSEVNDFFINVKQSLAEIAVVDNYKKMYDEALGDAKKAGQKALVEKIKNQIEVFANETKLIALGNIKYITDEQLIEFVKKCERGLRLDWIKNFTRDIPKEVLNKKILCDDRGVFDNYCILHYDPDGKSSELTEKEKERRKDPILFGLLKGSKKLYYVGDWIDEFCDLTFDKIIERKFNVSKAIKKNDLSQDIKTH